MRLEIEKKLDPCIVLSPYGQHYMELIEDEMKGQIIDKLFEMVEPYINVQKNYHEINMSLNVNTLLERAVEWNDGVPHMYDKQYLKIG